ncbi:MAG: sulfite exporter TauE/SafE family protein, partial [Candidatus Kapaibacterium sp.]
MRSVRFYLPFAAVVLVGVVTAVTSLDLYDEVFAWWPAALTMVFGSFIAGASAEGGGAIAFPVFTLLLKI